MRKVILFIAFLTTSLAANTQSTEKYSSTKSKFYYSFAWGLLTSKNFPKDKSAVFEFEKSKDTFIYEIVCDLSESIGFATCKILT